MFVGYITLYSMDTPYTYTYIHIYTYKYNVRYASCTCKEFNLEIEEFYENRNKQKHIRHWANCKGNLHAIS